MDYLGQGLRYVQLIDFWCLGEQTVAKHNIDYLLHSNYDKLKCLLWLKKLNSIHGLSTWSWDGKDSSEKYD